MKLRIDVSIPFTPAEVFTACRDELPALLPWLPQVESIERVVYEDNAAIVRTAYRWTARSRVPRVLQSVLGGERFSWTDHASWSLPELACEWWTESHTAVALRCAARDTFEADGQGGTRLCLRGELSVAAQGASANAGVSRLWAAPLEHFLVRKMQADLAQTAHALGAYLRSRRA